MPLHNRVDPFGAIHINPSRGLFMGNRGGCFHRDDQSLKPTRWASQRWIICVLEFKNRQRQLMQPGRYTELFFLDEATALAAGHRPCFECRRSAALAFCGALVTGGAASAPVRAEHMDPLIAGRIQPILKSMVERDQITPPALPDGALYAHDTSAFLKLGTTARPWSFTGYGAPVRLHDAGRRLTPAATCAALANGYTPILHSSAER